MSAPAGSPHPAAGARMPPKLGGAVSGLAPPQQNGPAQSPMQVPSGYGLPHQNYMVPSGHYSQGPGKMTSLPLDSQCDSYYSRPYTVPTQNSGTPSSANQPGAQQMYGRGPSAPHMGGSMPGSFQGIPASASHSYSSASQPYSSLGNRYSSPTTYSANASVASQGYPSTCSHYPISTVSNVVYPNVSYPSLPASEPYGQMFTSQSAPPPARPVKESYSGPSTALTYPSRPPPPPSQHQQQQQQQQQQQSHSGYSSLPWSGPALPPAQDSLIRNQMGSLATANSHPTNNENVQPPKSSSVVSTVLPGPSSTRMPPAPSHPVGPVPSAPPPPEQMQTKGVDSSSTTSSASPLPNSYDALEGGSYPDMHSSSASSPVPDHALEPSPTLAQALSAAPTPPAAQPAKVAKPFGYGYPALQPAYQNAAPPPMPAAHPSGPAYTGYPQHYPGVNQLSSGLGGLSLQSSPQPESLRPVNLTQEKNILPPTPIWAPVPNLSAELSKLNCSPEHFLH